MPKAIRGGVILVATPTRTASLSDLPLAGGGKEKHGIGIAGVTLVADPDGALFWPEQSLLAVADLHLEKGSSFAARGILLPPYDSAATLGAAGTPRYARYAPRCVIALGDSFHDGGGPARLSDEDRGSLMRDAART